MPQPTAHRRERGQSLVEFALALPILMILLSGLLDLGRVYFTYLTLQDSAAEAGLYLSLNPGCPFETGNPYEILRTQPDGNDVFLTNPAGGYNGINNDREPSLCHSPNNAAYRAFESAPNNGSSILVDWSLATMRYQTPVCPQINTDVFIEIEYPFELLTPFMSDIFGEFTLFANTSNVITQNAVPAGGGC